MGVSAYDEVDAPLRIQQFRQPTVLLNAYVGQQDGHVGVGGAVVVADDPDLLGGLLDVHEGAYDLLGAGGGQDLLGEDPDEHDLHAADLEVDVGLEQAGVVERHEQVRVDDGEPGALLKEEKMGETVVHLVVAYGGDVRSQKVDQIYGGQTHILRVNDGAAEHVAGYGVQHVLLLFAGPGDVVGEHCESAGPLSVDYLGKEVPVHVVGMQDGELLYVVRHICVPPVVFSSVCIL